MKTRIRHFDFWQDDWIAGTVGMTPEEEGLYIRIIARYYSRGEAPPSDPVELAHLCNVRPQIMRRVLVKLAPKFDETDGKLLSNRCETELKRARNRFETTKFGDTKAANSNGLDASHARTRDHPRARSHHTGSELSDPQEIRESSEPSRLRAREVALEGASLASAAPNPKSKRSVGEPGAPPWEQRCRAWAESSFWMETWGPPPSEAGCCAPGELAAEARKQRNGHDTPPTKRTPEDIVHVTELVKKTIAAINRKVAEPGMPTLMVVNSAVVDARHQRLNELAAWVGTTLDGDERTQAWEAIEKTRAAGDDTPPHVRRMVEGFEQIRQTCGSKEADE